MSEWETDEFDALLRRGMTSRPEASVPPDLAERAVARATPAVDKPRIRIWRTLSSLAACLLIVTMLSVGGWKWYRSASTSDNTTTDTSETSTVSSAYTTSSQSATLLLLGGGVFVLALGLLTLDRLLMADDSASPGALIF